MKQTLRHHYKDATLQVTVDAQNGEDEWANIGNLMEVIPKIVQCAGNWKHFEFHVVAKDHEEVGK